jgi:hypothetical protein
MPAIRQVMTSGFATLAMGSSRVYIRVSPVFLDTSVHKLTEQTAANAKTTSSIFASGAHSQAKGAWTENMSFMRCGRLYIAQTGSNRDSCQIRRTIAQNGSKRDPARQIRRTKSGGPLYSQTKSLDIVKRSPFINWSENTRLPR